MKEQQIFSTCVILSICLCLIMSNFDPGRRYIGKKRPRKHVVTIVFVSFFYIQVFRIKILQSLIKANSSKIQFPNLERFINLFLKTKFIQYYQIIKDALVCNSNPILTQEPEKGPGDLLPPPSSLWREYCLPSTTLPLNSPYLEFNLCSLHI